VSLRVTRLASARTREAETARAAARRRTYESRLQAIQARVEPQFLSNALARIRALGACHPEQATAMLDDLIAYLRAALPHLRESSSTLAREIDLARAWLHIAGAPQRESTGCVFDLDEAACDAAMPPMVLLPMIASVLDVGRVEPVPLRVCTSASDGRLRVAVGNAAMRRPGAEPEVAATIRERLHALYGERATLRITSTEDDGTCATLEMPHETADCDHR
jgi:LytS/YehU family sensor histidine kinase